MGDRFDSHITYSGLQGHVLNKGALKVQHNAYRCELRETAARTGQEFNSTHGFVGILHKSGLLILSDGFQAKLIYCRPI